MRVASPSAAAPEQTHLIDVWLPAMGCIGATLGRQRRSRFGAATAKRLSSIRQSDIGVGSIPNRAIIRAAAGVIDLVRCHSPGGVWSGRSKASRPFAYHAGGLVLSNRRSLYNTIGDHAMAGLPPTREYG
jgi:hypothetical protein